MLKRILLFIGLYFTFNAAVFGQLFPTQVTPVLNPPYATTIEDYANGFSDKITATIYTNDLNLSQHQVYLKVTIKGPNLLIESKPAISGYVPIYINGGEILHLSNQDLAPYFQYENLVGITPQQYSNSMPEGMYEFCIEVYDYATQQKFSKSSCAMAYFMVNQPPLLNTPINHENISAGDPQNILFTWTPMHLNATQVEYTFSIVEILDDQTPTQNAFLYSQPLYETTTANTVLNYGPAQPMLIAGKKYAWRVRAQVTEGISENAPFENDGYSVINDFTYAGNCPTPQFTLANPISDTQCEITWQPNSNFSSYLVQYRKLNSEEWFEVIVYSEQVMLYDLEAGETYQFRVGGNCISDLISFSNINNFTQPFNQSPEGVTCGLTPDLNLENQTPFSGALGLGEVFMAGDFPIHITKVSGSGTYTGEGWSKVPYLGPLKIGVTFSDIKINTDKHLIEGAVYTKYDEGWSNILDINDIVDAVEDLGDIITDSDDVHQIILDDIVIVSVDQISINEDTGEIEITDSDGNVIYTMDYDDGETYTIIDADGNTYFIDEDGNISQLGEGVGAITSENTNGINEDGEAIKLQNVGIKVVFDNSEFSNYKSKYFIDKGASENASAKIKENYRVIKDGSNNDYPIVYKAVAREEGGCGETPCFDWTLADIIITNQQLPLDSLIFTMNGTLIDYVVIDNDPYVKKYALKLPAFNSGTTNEVLALLKTANKNELVGAMVNVSIKEFEPINLTLIPVNGANVQSQNVENMLNEIYGGAGAKFNVSVAENWVVNDTQMEVGTSGWFTGYTSDQRNFINAYKNSGATIKNNEYYIFVTNGIQPTGKAFKGYMPFKKQFGFIYEDQTGLTQENKGNSDALIAHEIGHGVFELEHPWEQFSESDQLKTDWLMDYSNGTKLPYMHWQQIAHPEFRLYLFQKDEEAGNNVFYNSQFSDDFAIEYQGKKYMPLLTPNNKRIYLPYDETGSYIFHFLTSDYNTEKYFIPGSLTGFSHKNDKGEWIEYVLSDENFNENVIFDYRDKNGNKFNYQTLGKGVNNDLINILIPTGENGDRALAFIQMASNIDEYDGTNKNQIVKTQDLSFHPNLKDAKRRQYFSDIKIFGKESDDLTSFYKNIVLEFNENPEFMVILKIAELANLYPEFFENYTANWNNWTVENTFCPEDGLSYEWDCKMKYNLNLFNLYQSNKTSFYKMFLNDLEPLLDNYRSEKLNCLEDIQTNLIESLNTEQKECLEEINLNDLSNISFENKKKLLEAMLKEIRIGNKDEKLILKLIKSIKTSEYDDFITYLETGFIGRTIPGIGYNQVSIIYLLFSSVDDSYILFQGDNRKILIDEFLKIYYNSNKFTQDFKRINKSLTEGDKNNLSKDVLEFSHDYHTILERIFRDITSGPFGNHQYAYLTVNSNFLRVSSLPKINIQQRYQLGISWVTLKSHNFSPFDLLLLINNSPQNLLKDYNLLDENGKPIAFLAPAILLHYASEVGDIETSTDLFETTFDIASVFIPGGSFGLLSKIGKISYLASLTSGLSNIASNAIRYEDPELSELFALISFGTNALDFAVHGKNTFKWAIESSQKFLTPPQICSNINNYYSNFIKAKNAGKLEKLSAVESLELIEALKKNKEILIKNNVISDSKKIDEMIDILRNKINAAIKTGVESGLYQSCPKQLNQLRDFFKGIENKELILYLNKVLKSDNDFIRFSEDVFTQTAKIELNTITNSTLEDLFKTHPKYVEIWSKLDNMGSALSKDSDAIEIINKYSKVKDISVDQVIKRIQQNDKDSKELLGDFYVEIIESMNYSISSDKIIIPGYKTIGKSTARRPYIARKSILNKYTPKLTLSSQSNIIKLEPTNYQKGTSLKFKDIAGDGYACYQLIEGLYNIKENVSPGSQTPFEIPLRSDLEDTNEDVKSHPIMSESSINFYEIGNNAILIYLKNKNIDIKSHNFSQDSPEDLKKWKLDIELLLKATLKDWPYPAIN